MAEQKQPSGRRSSASGPDPKPPLRSGLIQGGRGGPEDELLEDGQEEVFSRTEVEDGHIEHHVDAGGDDDPASRQA